MALESIVEKVHNTRNLTPLSLKNSDKSKLAKYKAAAHSEKHMTPSKFDLKGKLVFIYYLVNKNPQDHYYSRLASQYSEIISSPDDFMK